MNRAVMVTLPSRMEYLIKYASPSNQCLKDTPWLLSCPLDIRYSAPLRSRGICPSTCSAVHVPSVLGGCAARRLMWCSCVNACTSNWVSTNPYAPRAPMPWIKSRLFRLGTSLDNSDLNMCTSLCYGVRFLRPHKGEVNAATCQF